LLLYFLAAVALLPFFADEILGAGKMASISASAAQHRALITAFYLPIPIKKKWVRSCYSLLEVMALHDTVCLSTTLDIVCMLAISGLLIVSVLCASHCFKPTPENMKGRVSAVNKFLWASNESGL